MANSSENKRLIGWSPLLGRGRNVGDFDLFDICIAMPNPEHRLGNKRGDKIGIDIRVNILASRTCKSQASSIRQQSAVYNVCTANCDLCLAGAPRTVASNFLMLGLCFGTLPLGRRNGIDAGHVHRVDLFE